MYKTIANNLLKVIIIFILKCNGIFVATIIKQFKRIIYEYNCMSKTKPHKNDLIYLI